MEAAVNTFAKVALKGCAGLGIVGSVSCLAIDYQPGDWVPLPPDAGDLMGYYEFGTRNELTDGNGGFSGIGNASG